jgi:dUTPase
MPPAITLESIITPEFASQVFAHLSGNYNINPDIIYIERLKESILPKTAYESATLDLQFDITEPIDLVQGFTYTIPLGIKSYMNLKGSPIMVAPRSSSSLVSKREIQFTDRLNGDQIRAAGVKAIHENGGLFLANTFGVIDTDYRGEWMARVYTNSTKLEGITLEPGAYYLQAVAMNDKASFYVMPFGEAPPEEYVNTTRGSGGFGSSGK